MFLCRSSSQDVNAERRQPAYLPARISGYDARVVPFDDDDEQQGEPVGETQQDEPAEETQADEPVEREQPDKTARETKPDEPAGETHPDELEQPEEPAEELPPGGSTQAEQHPAPTEDDADDSEGEWGAPPSEAGAASDDEEEWGVPSYQGADGEDAEEEPYYEYAAPYADPFAGFRDLRGGSVRPW